MKGTLKAKIIDEVLFHLKNSDLFHCVFDVSMREFALLIMSKVILKQCCKISSSEYLDKNRFDLLEKLCTVCL